MKGRRSLRRMTVSPGGSQQTLYRAVKQHHTCERDASSLFGRCEALTVCGVCHVNTCLRTDRYTRVHCRHGGRVRTGCLFTRKVPHRQRDDAQRHAHNCSTTQITTSSMSSPPSQLSIGNIAPSTKGGYPLRAQGVLSHRACPCIYPGRRPDRRDPHLSRPRHP